MHQQENKAQQNGSANRASSISSNFFNRLRCSAGGLSLALALGVLTGCGRKNNIAIPDIMRPNTPGFTIVPKGQKINLQEVAATADILGTLRQQLSASDSLLRKFLNDYEAALNSKKGDAALGVREMLATSSLSFNRVKDDLSALNNRLTSIETDPQFIAAGTQIANLKRAINDFMPALDVNAADQWLPQVIEKGPSYGPAATKGVQVRQYVNELEIGVSQDLAKLEGPRNAATLVSLRNALQQTEINLTTMIDGYTFRGTQWFMDNAGSVSELRLSLASTAQRLNNERNTATFNGISRQLSMASERLSDVSRSISSFDAISQNWTPSILGGPSGGELAARDARDFLRALNADFNVELSSLGMQRSRVPMSFNGRQTSTVVYREDRGLSATEALLWYVVMSENNRGSQSGSYSYSDSQRMSKSEAWTTWETTTENSYKQNQDNPTFTVSTTRKQATIRAAQKAAAEKAAEAERVERAKRQAAEQAVAQQAEKEKAAKSFQATKNTDRETGLSGGFGTTKRDSSTWTSSGNNDDIPRKESRNTFTVSASRDEETPRRTRVTATTPAEPRSSGFQRTAADRASGAGGGFSSRKESDFRSTPNDSATPRRTSVSDTPKRPSPVSESATPRKTSTSDTPKKSSSFSDTPKKSSSSSTTRSSFETPRKSSGSTSKKK